MPEGPSILILKEALQQFKGKIITAVGGNTSIDKQRLVDQKIIDFKTWGKHLLICFDTLTVRIHLMMFGSYTVNERKDRKPRLSLQFDDGEINFYTCSVLMIEEPLDELYDFTADVLNDNWDAKAARKKLQALPDRMICDALLDQQIFAGVGNIIKNEVLYRIKVHPKTLVGNMPSKKLTELLKEARNYSFDFFKWKKENTLKKHWMAYSQKTCPRDGTPFVKANLGKTHRSTFYCNACQVEYAAKTKKHNQTETA